MTVRKAMKEADKALNGGTDADVQDALVELMEEVDDFLTAIEDYDEWDALHYKGGSSPEPGLSLEKLRKLLGFNREGR